MALGQGCGTLLLHYFMTVDRNRFRLVRGGEMNTVSRLTGLPCKSNLRMPVGGGVPLPHPNSFYRSSVQLILRTGIRISLPAARRLSSSFHSPTTQQQPTFSFICTCQLSTSVIHSLLESLIQASYNLHSLNQLYFFILTSSSILTPSFTSSTHNNNKMRYSLAVAALAGSAFASSTLPLPVNQISDGQVQVQTSIPSPTTAAPVEEETVLSTKEVVITSCAPEVVSCPANFHSTSSIVVPVPKITSTPAAPVQVATTAAPVAPVKSSAAPVEVPSSAAPVVPVKSSPAAPRAPDRTPVEVAISA